MPLYYTLKSCKNIKLQNIVRFCKNFIIRHVIWHLKACTSKFATQNVLGTTMVPILLWNSPYSSTFFNRQYVNGAYKCDITTKHGTQVVPKNVFSKNIYFELSNAVSTIRIVILDQKLRPIQCSWFFDISSNLQKYHLFIENYEEIFNLHKDAKAHPDFIMARAIRRLKA